MDKNQVITFFDNLAESWDSMQVRNENAIASILDFGGVCEGAEVLDVACGTGVLFPDYIHRGVKSVTGIDISEKMLQIAGQKFPQVKLICDDAETYIFKEKYDVIMIYNAFPHFPEAERLIENLSKALKEGGRLTVAHGISMAEVEKCHKGSAAKVSLRLPCKEELSQMMSPYVSADVLISDENMYVVSGARI